MQLVGELVGALVLQQGFSGALAAGELGMTTFPVL